MALSFQLDPTRDSTPNENTAGKSKRSVLVTGATGNIGSYFAEHSHEQYQLKLMVRNASDERATKLQPYGEIVTGVLSDLDNLKQLCAGVDTVLHLAAEASAGTAWDDLLHTNIIGTYNVFVAAKSAGCKRLIFASSIHAISGYPADVQVKGTDPPNPGDLYGVSKCFGEALGRYMATHEGLSCIAVRIGAFQPLDAARDPKGLWMMDAFVSRRDLNQLFQRCIDAPSQLRFAIFAGLSDNRFKRMDISDARELVGYKPQDDLTEIHPALRPLDLDSVSAHSQADAELPSGLRNEL